MGAQEMRLKHVTRAFCILTASKCNRQSQWSNPRLSGKTQYPSSYRGEGATICYLQWIRQINNTKGSHNNVVKLIQDMRQCRAPFPLCSGLD